MKILLIEDEPGLASVIHRGLSASAFEVSVAADGAVGLEMAIKHKFDVIILDIMLPGINGIQICKEIRKSDEKIAILMLTALNSVENIVSGLDSGADDYLVKPFKFAELEARLRRLIQRTKTASASLTLITAGNLKLDVESKTVSFQGKVIAFTATEYRLLEFLVKNQNKVLSRIQILEHVWNIDFNMGTNVVDVYINYLRKKIAAAGCDDKIIHTVFGMGYMLKTQKPDEDPN